MSELFALKAQKDAAKHQIDLRNAALKLYNNREFRTVILDEFCMKECVRYVHTSCDPAVDKTAQADALALAQASGHLKRFLSILVQMGNLAERQMVELDEAILLASQEEGND